MGEFDLLSDVVKAWAMSNIVVHKNDTSNLLYNWVGGCIGFRKTETKMDTMLIVHRDTETWISFSGTKNMRAWISNFKFWPKNGFHRGIATGTEKILFPLIDCIPKHKPVIVTGHSRGDAMALYANYLLCGKGFSDVRSIGFSGPYIAVRGSGYKCLVNMNINHYHVETDGDGPIPSDPVDDVGALRGKHYGHIIRLNGSGGPFDHSYKSVTKNLIIWYLQHNVGSKYKHDIETLLDILTKLTIK